MPRLLKNIFLPLKAFYRKHRYKIKLRTSLLISYFVLIFLPFLLFILLFYYNNARTSAQQVKFSANHVLEQTAELLDYKIDNIIYASDQLFYDENMNDTIKRDENLPLGPDLIGDYTKMHNLIVNAFRENDMYRLILYLDSSVYYSNQVTSVSGAIKTAFSSISTISDETWYLQLQNYDGKVMWVAPSAAVQPDKSTVQVVSCVRFIKDIDNVKKKIGVLRIDLLKSDIDTIVSKACATRSGVAIIINSDGAVISSSGELPASGYEISTAFAGRLAGKSDKWTTLTLNGGTYVVGATSIQDTDWVLLSIIPYTDILAAGEQTRKEMLLLMMVIGTVVCILAGFFSNTVTHRIRSLTKKMKNVQSGNLPDAMEEEGCDEISILIQSYNYMTGEMKRMSEMQYHLGKEVKNAELKALQAQINPHFLYNTLDLINWTALRKNVPEISEIVQNLAIFYKLSLSNGKDVISVKDEISHAETYVRLQNFRFKNKISLIMDVEESMYAYTMIKLILQPIVENAIFHGILEKSTQTGTVTVTGRLENSTLFFHVEDDGVGMAEQSVINFFGEDNPKEEQGYGIKNVNHRIKLYYGNEYGLSCKSAPRQGTTVTVKIPAGPRGEQNNGE